MIKLVKTNSKKWKVHYKFNHFSILNHFLFFQHLSIFVEVAPSSLSLFRPVDIAYYLNAHARLDVRNDMLFNVFAREVARKAHNFTPRQLAEVIFSYAALGYRHAALFDILRKQVGNIIILNVLIKVWYSNIILTINK